jgi:hypothetical protein
VRQIAEILFRPMSAKLTFSERKKKKERKKVEIKLKINEMKTI